jgi:hypothetical protein
MLPATTVAAFLILAIDKEPPDRGEQCHREHHAAIGEPGSEDKSALASFSGHDDEASSPRARRSPEGARGDAPRRARETSGTKSSAAAKQC